MSTIKKGKLTCELDDEFEFTTVPEEGPLADRAYLVGAWAAYGEAKEAGLEWATKEFAKAKVGKSTIGRADQATYCGFLQIEKSEWVRVRASVVAGRKAGLKKGKAYLTELDENG